jgi:ABC-type multidrug transport system ATPase subunit
VASDSGCSWRWRWSPDPRLVVLDEMTTGLDPAARRVAWDLVAAIRDRGTTVLLVTHFMDEAERLCDRLAVLRDGAGGRDRHPSTS